MYWRQRRQRCVNRGGEVLEFVCDVSDADQVEALAQAAIGRFGAVHLLFNNAGVSGGMNSWASTPTIGTG